MPTVRGYFQGADRRPYVRVRVLLPDLRVSGDILLLVDTGADTTTVHWRDRLLLTTRDGEPLAPDTVFIERAQASGIANTPVEYGREDAVLVFTTEDGTRLTTDARVHVELSPQPAEVPSLLGRDVLSEARLDFNMPADELVLDWALV